MFDVKMCSMSCVIPELYFEFHGAAWFYKQIYNLSSHSNLLISFLWSRNPTPRWLLSISDAWKPIAWMNKTHKTRVKNKLFFQGRSNFLKGNRILIFFPRKCRILKNYYALNCHLAVNCPKPTPHFSRGVNHCSRSVKPPVDFYPA